MRSPLVDMCGLHWSVHRRQATGNVVPNVEPAMGCPRIVYTDLDTLVYPQISSTDLDVLWLLGACGACQVVGPPMATRWLVPPWIDQEFRDGALLRARGHHALPPLNHQKWPRAYLFPQKKKKAFFVIELWVCGQPRSGCPSPVGKVQPYPQDGISTGLAK
jgi:hypothetical protein